TGNGGVDAHPLSAVNGALVNAGGTLTVVDSTVSGNPSSGIANLFGTTLDGGPVGGRTSIGRTTIDHNAGRMQCENFVGCRSVAGGVFSTSKIEGVPFGRGTVTLTDSTLAANTFEASGAPANLQLDGGNATLLSSTVVDGPLIDTDGDLTIG